MLVGCFSCNYRLIKRKGEKQRWHVGHYLSYVSTCPPSGPQLLAAIEE